MTPSQIIQKNLKKRNYRKRYSKIVYLKQKDMPNGKLWCNGETTARGLKNRELKEMWEERGWKISPPKRY